MRHSLYTVGVFLFTWVSMTKYAKNVLECLFCHSEDIQKNGVLPRGGQRYNCTACHKHFTVGGEGRWTYDQSFKELIVDQYCHKHTGARDVAKKFHISTSTLIQRAKNHKQSCKKCQHT